MESNVDHKEHIFTKKEISHLPPTFAIFIRIPRPLRPCFWRLRIPYLMSQDPSLASPSPESPHTCPHIPVPLSPSHFYTQPIISGGRLFHCAIVLGWKEFLIITWSLEICNRHYIVPLAHPFILFGQKIVSFTVTICSTSFKFFHLLSMYIFYRSSGENLLQHELD